MFKKTCLSLFIVLAAVASTRAQLAITEAMSSASTNAGSQLVTANTD